MWYLLLACTVGSGIEKPNFWEKSVLICSRSFACAGTPKSAKNTEGGAGNSIARPSSERERRENTDNDNARKKRDRQVPRLRTPLRRRGFIHEAPRRSLARVLPSRESGFRSEYRPQAVFCRPSRGLRRRAGGPASPGTPSARIGRRNSLRGGLPRSRPLPPEGSGAEAAAAASTRKSAVGQGTF